MATICLFYLFGLLATSTYRVTLLNIPSGALVISTWFLSRINLFDLLLASIFGCNCDALLLRSTCCVYFVGLLASAGLLASSVCWVNLLDVLLVSACRCLRVGSWVYLKDQIVGSTCWVYSSDHSVGFTIPVLLASILVGFTFGVYLSDRVADSTCEVNLLGLLVGAVCQICLSDQLVWFILGLHRLTEFTCQVH